MFLFAPPPLRVLPIEGDTHLFYPLRNLYEAKANASLKRLEVNEVVYVPAKIPEAMPALQTSTATFYMGAAFGPKASLIGWVLGIGFERETLYLSEMKRAEKTIDPKDTVFWFTLNNEKALSDRVDRVFGFVDVLRDAKGIQAGDIVFLNLTFDYAPKVGDTLMLGLNGVGSFALKVR